MKKLISTLPEYTFIMTHELGPDEHAVLLRKGAAYAACNMQPRRLIATSPNYVASGHGLLSAPLTAGGLADLLHWTDAATAAARYRTLARLPGNVAALIPDRRPPG